MNENAASEDSADRKRTSITRRGVLKSGAGMAVAAVTMPAISGVASAHFHGPDKPTLDIDIKPGSDDNPINIGCDGVVPVAVLRTDEFDPANENVNYRFGSKATVEDGGGARPLHGGHFEAIDGDECTDLVLHFPIQGTGFSGNETKGHLHWEKGHRGAHHGLGGSDDITIVGTRR